MSLPPEVRSVVHEVVSQENPPSDPTMLLSEAVEKLAGRHPSILVQAVREEGGTSQFLIELLEYIKSVQDPRSRKSVTTVR